MEQRRVLEGELGCPGCRHTQPIRNGFADLRVRAEDVAAESPSTTLPAGSPDEALELAALLGVVEGPGNLVLLGSLAGVAPALAGMIPGIEIVAVDPRLSGWTEAPGVSRMAVGPGLPFRSRSLRGIALSCAEGEGLLQEAIRAVARLGRVVVQGAQPGAREILAAEAMEILLDSNGVAVGQRTS